jgi:hypothetical protein
MWRLVKTDVSEERVASIFRVENSYIKSGKFVVTGIKKTILHIICICMSFVR